jgi:drug/metabolite transporter (DMT)-like permease
MRGVKGASVLDSEDKVGIGLQIFAEGTPRYTKAWKLATFTFFCLLGLTAAFFWVFANSLDPIILGMPMGMFFLVCLVALSFLGSLLLLWLDGRDRTPTYKD